MKNSKSKPEESDKVENLFNQEAIEKLRELIKHNSICMFSTRLDEVPLSTRPMSVQQVDEQGDLWFLSARSSEKNADISFDGRVQLFFSNVSDQEYMTVFGDATIVVDREKTRELWTPIAKAWFNEGVDDPEISLLRVTPHKAHYWDTKSGRMVSMLKILVSAATGKTLEEGVRGDLTVDTGLNR